jgi:hypothetical protein
VGIVTSGLLDPRGSGLLYFMFIRAIGPNPTSPVWELNATPFWLENQYEMLPHVSIHVTVNG